MSRYALLAVFLVLWLESIIGVNLSLIPGLSAKNAAVYGFAVWLLLRSVLDSSSGSVLSRQHDLAGLNIAFLLLILMAATSVAVCVLLLKYPGYTLRYGIGSWKGYVVDHYLMFLLFFFGVRNQRDALWVAKSAFLLMAVGATIGIVDLFMGLNLGVLTRQQNGRVFSALGEANQNGSTMAFILPSLLALAWSARGLRRLTWLLGAGVCVSLLLATASRGGIVALIAGTIIGATLLRRDIRPRHLIQVSAIGVFGVLLALLLMPEQFSELVIGRLSDIGALGTVYNESSGRTGVWQDALSMLASSPATMLVGFGWRTFSLFSPIATHNDYLEYLFGLGIVGLMLFLYILTYVANALMRGLRASSGEARTVLSGFLVGHMCVLVAIFFVNLHAPWLIFWALTGAMLRVACVMDFGACEKSHRQ